MRASGKPEDMAFGGQGLGRKRQAFVEDIRIAGDVRLIEKPVMQRCSGGIVGYDNP